MDDKLPQKKYRGSIFLRDVPTHVKDHFKAFCNKRGITMKRALVEFMEQCIRKDERQVRKG